MVVGEADGGKVFQSLRKCMQKNVFLQSLARKLLAGVERRKVLVFLSFAGLFIELIAKAIKINKKVGCIDCIALSSLAHRSSGVSFRFSAFFFSKLQKLLFPLFYFFQFVRMSECLCICSRMMRY